MKNIFKMSKYYWLNNCTIQASKIFLAEGTRESRKYKSLKTKSLNRQIPDLFRFLNRLLQNEMKNRKVGQTRGGLLYNYTETLFFYFISFVVLFLLTFCSPKQESLQNFCNADRMYKMPFFFYNPLIGNWLQP